MVFGGVAASLQQHQSLVCYCMTVGQTFIQPCFFRFSFLHIFQASFSISIFFFWEQHVNLEQFFTLHVGFVVFNYFPFILVGGVCCHSVPRCSQAGLHDRRPSASAVCPPVVFAAIDTPWFYFVEFGGGLFFTFGIHLVPFYIAVEVVPEEQKMWLKFLHGVVCLSFWWRRWLR